MHIEQVEIYSDASNAAVLRHPNRRFPGCLIQGDTLNSLVQSLLDVKAEAENLSEETAGGLLEVCERLEGLLVHYKRVLKEHQIELPFNER